MMSVRTGAQLERSGERLQVGKWKVYVEIIELQGYAWKIRIWDSVVPERQS